MADLILATDTLNQGKDKINTIIGLANEAVADVDVALLTIGGAITSAQEALDNSEATQEQLDAIILESGTSDAETIQARGAFPLLYNRLNDVDSQSADIASKIPEVCNVKGFGALGDGITDDTSAIQSAINSLTNGGILFFPIGEYLLKGSGTELLLITKPIKIIACGLYSRLIIDTTVPNTTDVIRIYPTIGVGGEGYGIENLTIMPINFDAVMAGTGTPGGRHAIHLHMDNASQYLYRFIMRQCILRQLNGNGLKLTNTVSNSSLAQSTIRDNMIQGGIYLDEAGDSINILYNSLSRSNIGIYLKSLSGSSQNIIEGNNIVSRGGAIKIEMANQLKILYNQCEQVDPITTSETAMMTIGGSGIITTMVEIKGNNLNTHSNVEKNILLRNAVKVDISDNRLFNTDSSNFIVLESTVIRSAIHYNNMFEKNTGGTKTLDSSVTDNGIGTAHTLHNAVLQNNWVTNATYNTPVGYFKDNENFVKLKGMITGGTTTPCTKLFDLPVYFKPPHPTRFAVCTDTGYGAVVIDANGGVYYLSGGSAIFALDNISFYASNPT